MNLKASASWIVTGDKDLLELGNFHGARIVAGNEFLELIELY
jgi:predicted nucleic acid-binding protein